MIIMIPLDDNSKEATICVSLGRAPYFLVHDSKQATSQVLPNPAADAQGGAGIKTAQLIVDNKADALITPRCGQNAAEVLQAAQVAIYKASGSSVADNIKLLEEGKLDALTSFHAGFHGK